MRAFTDETITTEAELEADLVIVRERGWAIAHGELRNDIGSVAAPILGPGNQPVASLSVVFPLHRMPVDGCVKWGHLVSDAAAKVAGNLWGNQSQHRTGSRS
jgi:IclR family acetate operon transcriptional repressor